MLQAVKTRFDSDMLTANHRGIDWLSEIFKTSWSRTQDLSIMAMFLFPSQSVVQSPKLWTSRREKHLGRPRLFQWEFLHRSAEALKVVTSILGGS